RARATARRGSGGCPARAGGRAREIRGLHSGTRRRYQMTQIGFIGLGKMGGNMVRRVRRDSEHEVVAFDFERAAVQRAVKRGAQGARSLKELVKALHPPRMVWLMVPAGDPTQQTVDALARLLDRADVTIDGGH